MLKKSLSLVLFMFIVLCLQGQPFLQTLWSESYDISSAGKTEMLVPVADGSVILGGSGVSPAGGVNIQLIKISSTGSILCQKVYSGEGDRPAGSYILPYDLLLDGIRGAFLEPYYEIEESMSLKRVIL